VSRLSVGLRREKAVDLAMSRATITETRREADGAWGVEADESRVPGRQPLL